MYHEYHYYYNLWVYNTFDYNELVRAIIVHWARAIKRFFKYFHDRARDAPVGKFHFLA